MTATIISTDELEYRVRTGKKQIVLASLWEPDEHSNYEHFKAGHIPTARFCDAALALADIPSASKGRNPLPTKTILERWFKYWGLDDVHEVIVYDDKRGFFAARAWWTLKWAGVSNVRILDGGQQEWVRRDYPMAAGPGNPCVYDNIVPSSGHMPTATIQDVKAHTGLLIDARETNRFAGRKEYLDLKAGHIPGAINIPNRAVMNPKQSFKPAEELREIFASHGVTRDTIADAIIYSGSGNHSAQVIAAMNIAGLGTPRHYVGGWSQWCANRNNPVERGV